MRRWLAISCLIVACASPPPETRAPEAPPAGSSSPPASTPPVAEGNPKRPPFESPGGMWIPNQLEAHAETLKKLGLELDPKVLSDPMAYPLGAVVSLGGCSASFVSADGLIATNHHCVTGALQYNSTPKENLLKDGYLAKKRSDERWAGPTARVYVTQAFTDVTKQVRDGIEKIKNDKQREEAIEKRVKELVAKCEQKPNVRCEVAGYFGDAQHLLIEKLEIKDVRLVYAPHEGIGNFGGEIDNWRWPRHGADFSLLRAYVGSEGKPADHAPGNVPFKPRLHLRIAKKPLRAGDLVFVAGYPGRTYRLSTAEETADAVDWFYPKRLGLFADYLALIEKLGKDDPDTAIKARPLERGLANAQTYTKGSLEGLTRGGAAEVRKKRDAELRKWIDSDTDKKKRFGGGLARMDEIFKTHEKYRERDFALDEIMRFVSLVRSAHTIVRMAEERPKPDADRDPEFQERNWQRYEQDQQALEKRYARKLDSALLELVLTRIAKLEDAKLKTSLLKLFLGNQPPTPENIKAAVQKLYAGTQLEDTKRRVELLKTAKTAELRASTDPIIRLSVALRPLMKEKEDRLRAESGAFAIARPLYVTALREQSTTPIAPDANGTLRVTYGTVRGYRPKPDASVYEPFTKLRQVADKATGKEPFDAPARMVELAKKGKGGPYMDSALGAVPVDFLSDCDITGGNSGSPTLDARGELVGLAFDGNYEAMASDWVFMPDLSRTIHVDIRYVLWLMDAVDPADHLLREMGLKPALG